MGREWGENGLLQFYLLASTPSSSLKLIEFVLYELVLTCGHADLCY